MSPPMHENPAMTTRTSPTRGAAWRSAALGLALAALFLAACGERRTVVIYQQSPPPQTFVQPAPVYQPPPPPPPQPQPVVVEQQWNDEETNVVIYREYYGCSEDEIYAMPHYRRYYNVDNDDLFFVCFVARHAQVSFDVAFNQWYFGCGRDCNRMVVYYRVDPGVFFVYSPPGYAYPPIYAHSYACYHNQQLAGASFSSGEYHALVSLRIGVEYQGTTTDMFFRNTATYGGSPSRVVYQNRERCGTGGQGCAGASVRVGVHPWTMSAGARAQWRQDDANRRSAHEAPFREQHRDNLARVQRGEGARPGEGDRRPGEAERHPGEAEPRPGEPGGPARPQDQHLARPQGDQRQPGDRPQGDRQQGGDQRQQGERQQGGDPRQQGDRPQGSDQRAQTQHQQGGGDPGHSSQAGQQQQRSQDSRRPSDSQGGKDRDSK